MTMQECYKAIGGNYEAVLGRLHSGKHLHNFYFPMPVLTVDNSGLQGTLM